ncbi:hypothetical protein G3H63_13675 [Microbacterium resistens]|uniref:XRE family transcriptional regulator n=1 Tax=Microbacterium resistens TaxID=156977 RepID=A0ABY3RSM8_9MICO|nr:hypothetical protein [Microbacterium resistens]MBW1640112.1 hypothetical protein [Microbacterium resistens]UGS25921.1 hypothetical protein K8F61_14895 [Microbacterium resistens]
MDHGTTAPPADTAFSRELRRAIAAHGISLARLRDQLRARGNPVSVTTLSYWRSGSRRPEGPQSLAAVDELERILGLVHGSLRELIGPTHRTGPIGGLAHPLAERNLEDATAEVMTALGMGNAPIVRDVSTHVVTEVGDHGDVLRRSMRSLIQSTTGILTAFPYVELSPGMPIEPPVFRAVAGARVGHRVSHPDGEVHGVVFELDRPIGPAETALIEWELSYPPDRPSGIRETGHGVARQSRDVLLWTRFHPDAVPDWLEEHEETPESTTRRPIALTTGTAIHQVRRRFGPGLLALSWGFGDAP